MTAVTIPGTKRTDPPEDADPQPREPVSAKAQIASISDERRRQIAKRIRQLTEELRALVFEDATLAAHGIIAGVQEGE